MEMMNRCIEDASDYRGMMDKLLNPDAIDASFPSEKTGNRQQRRAAEKLERRATKAPKKATKELLK